MFRNHFVFILIITSLISCKTAVKEQEDKIYSRHLQQHIPLRIITTPMPDDKSRMNFLLINGEVPDQYLVKHVVDSLWKEKLIQPITIVTIALEKPAGINDISNEKTSYAFENFLIRELLPFSRKKVVIKKFKAVAVYGEAEAGFQLMKTAWKNSDKVSWIGISQRNTDSSVLNKTISDINLSRRRPSLNIHFSTEKLTVKENQLIQILTLGNQRVYIDSSSVSDSDRFVSFLLNAFRQ